MSEEEEEVFEEKEEKREERPDTLSGLIQSIIPLMIIPQILPLFQQSLSQTLRETTLNVKVESSMAIIPIDIAAQTAIVAVDIKSQSVTLNVNITGQDVTLNVNITSQTTTLNVNVTNSTLNVNVTNSTLNISISGQTVDIKIYTPSGRWTTVSQTVVTSVIVNYVDAYPGEEVTVFSVTGRGRLINMGVYFCYAVGSLTNVYTNVQINIYVDGSLKLSFTPMILDSMTGFMVDMLRGALMYAISSKISPPYNIAKIGANPDRYLIRPENVNPNGSLTWAIWDHTNGVYTEMGGFIKADEEFFNSLVVTLKNITTADTRFAIAVTAMVGAYP
ncbi:MAG: hypothetical protein QXF58_06695 [Desulfurococcaceae archaeon]